LAVFGAVELARWGGSRLVPAGVAIVLFETLTVLCLRAHWTMDVYAGIVSALLVAFLVNKIARPVDRLLGLITTIKSAHGEKELRR
jgi:hypothetical protein